MNKQIKTYLIYLFFLVFFSQEISAQIDRKVIEPVDVRNENTQAILALDKGLYKITTSSRSDLSIELKLSFYNKISWTSTSSILLSEGAVIKGMIEGSDGDIYIYGRFKYLLSPSKDTFRNILEFNKTWKPVVSYTEFEERSLINTAFKMGDSILFGGRFANIGSTVLNNLAFLDNGTFSAIEDQSGTKGCNGTVQDILIDDNIYVAGNFTNIGSANLSGIAKFESNQWTKVLLANPNVTHIAKLGNFMYFRSLNSINEIKKVNLLNQNVSSANTGIDSIYVLHDLAVFRNQLMTFGSIKMNGGFKTGWLTYNNLFWSSVNAAKWCNNQSSTSKILYVNGINLLGPLSQVRSSYIGSLSSNRKLIYGSLFFDLNKSCELEMGDYPIGSTAIKFGTERFATYTNQKGLFYHYFDKVENKMPRVLLQHNSIDFDLCIKDSTQLKVINQDLIGPIQIGLQPNLDKLAKLETKAIIHNGAKIIQKGRSVVTYIVRNTGFKNAQNVTVKWRDKDKIRNAVALPDFTEEDSFYQWNLDTIRPFEVKFITMAFALDNAVDQLANIVQFEIEHEFNNSEEQEIGLASFQQTVTDEDFEVNKEQSLPNNTPLLNNAIASTDTIIEYQINFQNRTNDIIKDVMVIDTVDLSYNLLYTRTIASSHDFVETISQDPDNSDQTVSNVNVLVRINAHQYKGGVEGLTV